MSVVSPKSIRESLKAVQGLGTSSLVGRTCGKGRFWDWSEKEKDLWTVEVMMMKMN